MPKSLASPTGRALLFLLLVLLAILAAFDLTGRDSMLTALWESLFPPEAPVERVRDDLVDGLQIPR